MTERSPTTYLATSYLGHATWPAPRGRAKWPASSLGADDVGGGADDEDDPEQRDRQERPAAPLQAQRLVPAAWLVGPAPVQVRDGYQGQSHEAHAHDGSPDVRLQVERDGDESVHAVGPHDREGRHDAQPAGTV